MQIALDSNGKRIIPSATCGRGNCPFCGGTVKSKCGEINIWHWSHYENCNCDSWWEPETEWHRNWKSKFPASMREVIIDINGERHITDIKTNSGLVIEFQNSSISTKTIREREAFYGNMIWVINADKFKENFDIRSKVKSDIRRIEQRYNDQISALEKDIYHNLKAIKEEIENCDFDLLHKKNSIKAKSQNLKNSHFD